MAHFAQIDENNRVIQVLVVEQDQIDTGLLGDPNRWIKTSYNTRGGIYYDPVTNQPAEDQSRAFRKNFAGVDMYYDPILDAFIPDRPYPSWILNTDTGLWDPPVPYPLEHGKFEIFVWDEATVSWVLIDEQPNPVENTEPISGNVAL